MKNKIKGFTLIELLIVIGIIAILAAAIIVAITPGQRLQDAREATVKAQMQAIGTDAYRYVIDNSGTTPADLTALDVSPAHPNGGTYTFGFDSDGRITVSETAGSGSCVFSSCYSQSF
jgi:type IV pilus assembly protein PilE